VYVSEIFPNHLRPAGVAFGLSAFYLASEVTLVGAPVALNKIGWKFYLVLIIPSGFYWLIIFFFFPETKNRTLEEIGDVFGDETHVASHWYKATPEEKERMAREALKETEGGIVRPKGYRGEPADPDTTPSGDSNNNDKIETVQAENVVAEKA
jgi:energy-coupling factor transporter transmembrane protein EcfT